MPPQPDCPIDEECRCLLTKLVDSTGPVWDGSAIARLRDILDEHYYKAVTWGLHYRSVLSISTIIRIVDLLASADIFDENDQSDDFALELHLRCLVAALRVLTLFGTYNCVGFLTFDLLEKLYNSLAKWAHYHSLRSQKGYRSHYSGSLQNYNNEFLIVYARDLVASVSSDRDLMIQAVARVAAGVNLTHSYAKGAPPVPKSLLTNVQQRLTPSSWHTEFRAIENFLLYVRLFNDRHKRIDAKGLVKEAVKDLATFSHEAEIYLLNVLKETIQRDIHGSNQVTEKLEPGTLPFLADQAYRKSDDVIETTPVARSGHFTYALLDLIQGNLRPAYTTKQFDALMEISFYVAKTSKHSFLRRKAFEVLHLLGTSEPNAMAKVEKALNQARADHVQIISFKKASTKWPDIKRRAEEVKAFRAQLASVTLFSSAEKTQRSLRLRPLVTAKLDTLVNTLEELLVCPTPSSQGEVLLQLLPCGHCHSRLAWLNSQNLEQNYCAVCQTKIEGVGPPLPAGQIGDVLQEMKFECIKLENWVQEYKIESPAQSPTRMDRPPLTRTTTSESSQGSLRQKFSDFRLFKKQPEPNTSRRSSIATDERSLLRTSTEGSILMRGMHVRNRIRVLGTPNPGYTYQATAISADCKKVALVSLADFVIHEVTSTFESQIVCWGDNTKRFAPQPKITVEQKSATSYHIAALSNRVLAIASQEAFVDIRNAGTGERINLLRLDPSDLICRTIDFSPDGQHLAVGFENGDVLIFQAGLLFDFAGESPIRLRYKEGGFHKIPVVSVAFSHDSSLMAICTKDNVVRCYRLDHLSDGFFEEYVEPATYGKRGSPADISDLAFLSDSHSLYIISKTRLAYPTIITKITSPRENQRAQILASTNPKHEEEDYRVACYPKESMLAAALVTSAGEFLLTYLSPTGTNVWAVTYHTERLDMSSERESGFCSVGFSDSRALAVDRRANLLSLDLIFA